MNFLGAARGPGSGVTDCMADVGRTADFHRWGPTGPIPSGRAKLVRRPASGEDGAISWRT